MASKLIAGLVATSVLGLASGTAVRAQKPADAIDSVQSEVPGIQTDLLEVKRMSDNTIRVRWRWRNTTDKPITFPTESALQENSFLLDPVNKKKHLVVTDTNHRPIGSLIGNRFGEGIAANQALMVWARFPAPPPSVGKVTVVIASTPPFEDISIAK